MGGLLLHVIVALKRSWDISINYCINSGRWNMLLSGLVILTFLVKHLLDFRFNFTLGKVILHAPKYYFAVDGLTEMRVFWEKEGAGIPMEARDVYSREAILFKQPGTVLFYSAAVCVFVTHMALGWKKLIPADEMQIPRDHQKRVIYLGWIAA